MKRFHSQARLLVTRSFAIATATLLLGSFLATAVHAQSGTRTQPSPRPSTTSQGSGTKTAPSAVGLQGYCPVCIIKMKKWIKGDAQHSAQYDGKTYLFPGAEQKQMFLSDPTKYTPILGGDCVVALVEMGKRVPGSLQFAELHEDHLYLFANEKAKGMFQSNKEKYAHADIALGGKCTVCRVEMNKDVDGVPQFASSYKGMRYLFPGQEQQQMFNQNPSKYEVTK
ncbi:YHS domain-containing protein [Neorhodopirellula lusitana]|uniref:YHS domain-containing protein n=1 Tax=Neorhodopirellula lusitana TaxID=445327 RepID=A0ABY1PRB5_9BACT|nr:hypothetical protein [Neorhodopirellula lusitana]SMP43645.1 YHS domain-containing protein [Neorhodopirellula lusitana]